MAFSFSNSISKYYKKFSVLEIVLIIAITLYLILNVETPKVMIPFLLSPLGMIIVIMIPFYLFISVNPIIGVLSLFVAHKLLSTAKHQEITIHSEVLKHYPSQFNTSGDNVSISEKHIEPPKNTQNTLEEDVVSSMAPIGISDSSAYIKSSYKPITLDDHRAVFV